MQAVLQVYFKETGIPSPEAVVEEVTKGVDSAVRRSHTMHGPRGWSMNLTFAATGEEVPIEGNTQDGRIMIEVFNLPSYFQWAIVVALSRLGGRPRSQPPAFAEKPFAEVTWWDNLQLRRRVLGR